MYTVTPVLLHFEHSVTVYNIFKKNALGNLLFKKDRCTKVNSLFSSEKVYSEYMHVFFIFF